jgi:hypothetical protein
MWRRWFRTILELVALPGSLCWAVVVIALAAMADDQLIEE